MVNASNCYLSPMLACALLFTLFSTAVRAQLDDTWTVTINGQSAQVYPDGSFRIANIPAFDDFPADGFSDALYRLTGMRTSPTGVHYARSTELIRIPANGTITLTAPILVRDFPFEDSIESLQVTAAQQVLEPGEMQQLAVTAELSSGGQGDVTLSISGTSYHSTNAAVAEVTADGLVAAVSVGTAFITATNEGSTATRRIEVVTDAVTTTVEGFVQQADGSAVSGAIVTTLLFGGIATTNGSGFFSFPLALPSSQDRLTVTANVDLGGQPYVAIARDVIPVSEGITDSGILTLTELCDGEWAQGLFPMPATNGPVWVLASLDDGTGLALYAGGQFTRAGSVTANSIARWDGTTWSSFGGGVSGTVIAIAMFDDDGPGPNPPTLFVAGQLSFSGNNYILKWTGTQWTTVGGIINGKVLALTVLDDGATRNLYAAGEFTNIGGTTVNRVAKLTGSTWTQLSTGMNAAVNALAVFDDDGAGPNPLALYAGGLFTTAGGVAANHLAKWSGSQWLPLGTGLAADVYSLSLVDEDGSGSMLLALYAGLSFFPSGFSPVHRWDGAQWLPLGSSPTGSAGQIRSLATFDLDGDGPTPPSLFAAGNLTLNGFGRGVFRWSGSQWESSPFNVTVNNQGGTNADINTFCVHTPAGESPQLYFGGNFLYAGPACPTPMSFIATWNGSETAPLPNGLNAPVRAMTVFDQDQLGPAPPVLYAAGRFRHVDGAIFNSIAKWNGAAWSALDSGLNVINQFGVANPCLVEPLTLATLDEDGSGATPPALYVGGHFNTAGSVSAANIAKWTGNEWFPLGSGLYDSFGADAYVYAISVFDEDDTGPGIPALYAGGYNFNNGPGINAIAIWNGIQWSAVGGGFSSWSGVNALAVFDPDGAGPEQPALYAGGGLFSPAGTSFDGIAKWNGTTWSSVGGGLGAHPFYGGPTVGALAVFDDGTGPGLYVTGLFSTAGGSNASFIAKWDGAQWEALGAGLDLPADALVVFDDGTGSALYAGGSFSQAGGVMANSVARWDGKTWTPLGSGITPVTPPFITDRVKAFALFDDGQGPALFSGGAFDTAGGNVSRFLAKWSRPLPPCP